MVPDAEVRAFLARWANVQAEGDVDRVADFFLRDPAPLVTFSDGERANDWLDVRIRLGKDLERVVLERVETHHVVARDLGDAVVASFLYDLHARDLWGTPAVVTRHATMTLARTKDGFRIAAAHFSKA